MRVVAQDYVEYFLDDVPVPSSRMKWRDLAGKPYIWHVVERLKRCKGIDEVILFTQDTPENKEVVDLAKRWDLNLRYFGKPMNWDSALKWYGSLDDSIVINAPFPLTDPDTLNSIIDYFIAKDLDYLEIEGASGYSTVFKEKIWPKLYELEKDYEIILSSWTTLLKERNDLFKSHVFGKINEVKLGIVPFRPKTPIKSGNSSYFYILI